MDPDEDVGHSDELEVCLLGIGEVDLWLPDGLDQVGVSQVQGSPDVFMREPRIGPLLPQVCVGHVVLGGKN